jgi:hypothetical protein
MQQQLRHQSKVYPFDTTIKETEKLIKPIL